MKLVLADIYSGLITAIISNNLENPWKLKSLNCKHLIEGPVICYA